MQVRTADVADEQGVAREHQPRLVVAAAAVGDDIRVVRGCMPRRRQGAHDRVAELDDVRVLERHVRELDAGVPRQVRLRSGRGDERRQAGDVIGLDVRLEHRDDRRACTFRLGEVRVDEVGVGVDDREPRA